MVAGEPDRQLISGTPSMRSPEAELQALDEAGLLRRLRPLDTPAGPEVAREGRQLVNFASNDYLGLASHPALADAFVEGTRRYGAGSAASRLVCGTLPPHAELEDSLAAAKRSGAALVFSSGFATALGCIPAIAGKEDTIVLDKLCHASLIDAAKLSGATLRVFPHNDLRRLETLLRSVRARDPGGRVLILTESVFSMDGDLCPLEEIVRLAEAHDALLWLDEAHAFGVLGPTGMGLAEQLGLQDRVTFQMGTLSKAAGLSGGYVAASRAWIDLFVNRARAFVYSTAPPPALAHAAITALELIRSAEGADRRARLHGHIRKLSPAAASPVVPVILGSNEAALAASRRLEEQGLLVPAIRYPTVPRGKARLRISLSAAHRDRDLDSLIAGLGSPDPQLPS